MEVFTGRSKGNRDRICPSVQVTKFTTDGMGVLYQYCTWRLA